MSHVLPLVAIRRNASASGSGWSLNRKRTAGTEIDDRIGGPSRAPVMERRRRSRGRALTIRCDGV